MGRFGTSALIVLAVGVLVASSIGALGASTESCAVCHSAEVDHTRSSAAHSRVECQQCHQRPGALGVVEQRVRMLGMMSSALAGKHALRADVPDARCLDCHWSVANGTVEGSEIRVRHSDLLSAGLTCVSCHGTVPHEQTVRAGRVVTMGGCQACHDGSRAPRECGVCHKGNALTARSPHPRASSDLPRQSARRTHLQGGQNTCVVCHPRSFCVPCHGVELPHPESILDTHGRIARGNREACLACHDSELCSGCHLTAMPHSDGFLRGHGAEVARAGKAGCLSCHMEAGCDGCHVRHLHPGLTPERISELQQGG